MENLTGDRWELTVRGLRRDVEIGVFAEERGVRQTLRFDIVVGVAAPEAAGDRIDRVLSYDTLVEAVDRALAKGRYNLLESLAESISAFCLEDERTLTADVRVEKSDRGPEGLGVRLTRRRADAPSAGARVAQGARVPLVALVGAVAGRNAGAWRDWLVALDGAVILLGDPAAAEIRFGEHPAKDAATTGGTAPILALRATAAILDFVDGDARFDVAESRAEAVHLAARNAKVAMLTPPSEPALGPALAEILAAETGGRVVALGAALEGFAGDVAASPAEADALIRA